jgi:hypothetical protein
VANRNKRHRGRARKRRPSPASAAADAPAVGAAGGKQRGQSSSRTSHGSGAQAPSRGVARSGRGLTGSLALGERPLPPWHPLPLSELLILVGAIGTVVGLGRGESGGAPLVVAGLVAVLIGTVEVTLREHLSGYRAHTLILTVLPAIALYSAVVILARPPRSLNLVLLVLDIGAAVLVFKRLRARFLQARHERTLAAGG